MAGLLNTMKPSASWGDGPALTADTLRNMLSSVPRAPPPIRFMVIPSWLSGYRWVDGGPCRQPPPLGKRKGTRRQWKRRNNRNAGWRRRWVHIEPDHMIQQKDGVTYCTEAQFRAIKAQVPEAARR